MRCYGLLFGVVQPFPYKWGNLHLFLFLFIFWFIWKTENISLYFCFTAYLSELLFVLLATIGSLQCSCHGKLQLPYSGYPKPNPLSQYRGSVCTFCKVWFSCEVNHKNTMTETCLTLPSSKTTGRDWEVPELLSPGPATLRRAATWHNDRTHWCLHRFWGHLEALSILQANVCFYVLFPNMLVYFP